MALDQTERKDVLQRIYLRAGVIAVSIVLSLASTAVLFLVIGKDPLAIYTRILGVLASPSGWIDSATRSLPILLSALGLVLPFKMRFWNIGSEGQLYMGAFGATLAIQVLPPSLGVYFLPAVMGLAVIAGGLYAILPTLLKTEWEVNEVLTTLMLNFVAIYWVNYLVFGPWKDPGGVGFPMSKPFPVGARFPLIPGTNLDIGILVAGVAAVGLWLILKEGKLGYEVKVLGQSLKAGKYAGISLTKTALIVMFVSGALAGLGGGGLVSTTLNRLRPNFSPGYGYMGILVVWLAGLNPAATFIVSILFGWLLVSGDILQIAFQLPFSAVLVFQSLILIFSIASNKILTSMGRWN